MVKLTENDRAALKLLIENARVTDTEIATKLDISSQAVGKIRRKLEKYLIENYTVNLDYEKIGIDTIAIAISRLTKEGLDFGEDKVEQRLQENPHILNVYRISKGSSTHVIMYAFQNIDQLEEFFHSRDLREKFHDYLEVQEMFTLSRNCLVKNNPKQLFHKAIDTMGTRLIPTGTGIPYF